jgi:hypothetical protein
MSGGAVGWASPSKVIILGAWTLWKHLNDLFNGACWSSLMALILDGVDSQLWSMAKAKGISLLATPVLIPVLKPFYLG